MSGTFVTLAEVVDKSLSTLDSLVVLLFEGGHEDTAAISAGLLRDARAQLIAAVRCVEIIHGRPVVLLNAGGVLCPAPCIRTRENPESPD